jgi:hypothetical protein
MSGAIPPLPQYAFMAWCSFKAQRQIHFLPLPFAFHSLKRWMNDVGLFVSILFIFSCSVCPAVVSVRFHCFLEVTNIYPTFRNYVGVSKSFRTGHLERELQMVQPSATRCSYIAIVWVSLASFAVITLCVASQQVIPKVSVYFVIESVWKFLDTPS